MFRKQFLCYQNAYTLPRLCPPHIRSCLPCKISIDRSPVTNTHQAHMLPYKIIKISVKRLYREIHCPVRGSPQYLLVLNLIPCPLIMSRCKTHNPSFTSLNTPSLGCHTLVMNPLASEQYRHIRIIGIPEKYTELLV